MKPNPLRGGGWFLLACLGAALGVIVVADLMMHGEAGVAVAGLYFFLPAGFCLWQGYKRRSEAR